ncbi:torsin-1A-interacting protein 2-like isoform X2 [Phycodurus eques]|uniref:torsin-1A-interacting protein 2-like isoform X2 n=1 Tax=Phycodurus eques TaxID=693459 RepID=UPI002ACDCDA5|nr:torsin-1A-interacting protein 2-like isoform X2 [Phycodurus eques]
MAEPLDPADHLQQEEAAGIKGEDNQSTVKITQQQHCLDSDEPDERTVPLTDGWSQGAQRDEEPTMKEEFAAGVDQLGDEEAPEHTTPATDGDTNHDHADDPIERLQEDLLFLNDTTNDDQKESRIWNPEEEETTQVPRKASMEEMMDDRSTEVEAIGPTTQETTDLEVTGQPGVKRYLIGIGILLALVAMVVQHVLSPEPPPPSVTFLRKLEKVESRFPRQRPELWNRSRIHLKRHLLTQRPSQPVSLILTAGVAGRQTLRCLARDLASAFSSSLNGSVLHIDGASRAGEDSDQVKLDIDGQLQWAFEGDKPVAVIHRFEQLPPGSTLIFYRYCDHENAAYKKTFLIFTVLLEEEEDIPAGTSLSAVEEMVDDHLQRKFLSHSRPLAFDRMDLDKYSGLWSRISHLILPVAAEAWTAHESCW